MTGALPAVFATPDAAAVCLRVGDWQVAPDLNRIARGGKVVVLEPKVMALLVVLASRAGQVFSRDELMAAVWPGVVVGDNALTQVVIKLRRALGDSVREPKYLQAIAKKGYRLVAPVQRCARQPVTASLPDRPEQPQPKARHARRWSWPWLAGVGAAVAVAAGFASMSREFTPGPIYDEPESGVVPTIAVRPFEGIDAGPRPAPIARAISADLMTDLSKVSSLRVVGEPSVGSGAGKSRYLLTGTVQRDGARLRLNVLLTESATGRLLWSKRFDRHITDLFSVQDELVTSILHSLAAQVSAAETYRIANRSTRNLQAWEQFVRAQSALLVRQPDQNAIARALYWDAIRLDPAFSRAYAGLAMTYALDAQQGWAADTGTALTHALELAQASVKMNPDLPQAHWVMAFVQTQRRRYDEALADVDDALRLNRSYADAYALKAGIDTYLGRPSDAIGLLRLAQRLNPEGGSLYFLLLGRAYYFLGDQEQAQLNLGQALARNAENVEARVYLAASLWQAGDRDVARRQVNEIDALDPGFRVDSWLMTYPLAAAGERRRLRATLAEVGLRLH